MNIEPGTPNHHDRNRMSQRKTIDFKENEVSGVHEKFPKQLAEIQTIVNNTRILNMLNRGKIDLDEIINKFNSLNQKQAIQTILKKSPHSNLIEAVLKHFPDFKIDHAQEDYSLAQILLDRVINKKLSRNGVEIFIRNFDQFQISELLQSKIALKLIELGYEKLVKENSAKFHLDKSFWKSSARAA